jgi:hypothetical protein
MRADVRLARAAFPYIYTITNATVSILLATSDLQDCTEDGPRRRRQ